MDVMEVRRRLMMMGAGNVAVGVLSKYEKRTLTFPNAVDSAESWDNGAVVPCSFAPKIIIFHGGTSQNGNILSGIFCFAADESIGAGVANVINVGGTATRNTFVNNNNVSSGRFKYDSGVFYASRSGSGVTWSNADEYTFEIYG